MPQAGGKNEEELGTLRLQDRDRPERKERASARVSGIETACGVAR